VDILQFSLNPDHKSPKWPEEYWPRTEAPSSDEAWERSVSDLFRDLESVCQMVSDPKHDLLAELPHGNGQTLLREALLVADHNAYHLGELVMLRRILEGK
jgi:hypothetical protein